MPRPVLGSLASIALEESFFLFFFFPVYGANYFDDIGLWPQNHWRWLELAYTSQLWVFNAAQNKTVEAIKHI